MSLRVQGLFGAGVLLACLGVGCLVAAITGGHDVVTNFLADGEQALRLTVPPGSNPFPSGLVFLAPASGFDDQPSCEMLFNTFRISAPTAAPGVGSWTSLCSDQKQVESFPYTLLQVGAYRFPTVARTPPPPPSGGGGGGTPVVATDVPVEVYPGKYVLDFVPAARFWALDAAKGLSIRPKSLAWTVLAVLLLASAFGCALLGLRQRQKEERLLAEARTAQALAEPAVELVDQLPSSP